MKKIVIDARIINSSTGRYVERFLENLQEIDAENNYIVLVPKKDLSYWQPKRSNFKIVASDYKSYSLSEQIGFCWQLYMLRADLVHYCMPQQPILYFRQHVTAVLDLTLFKINPRHKNSFVFSFKQFIGRGVFFAIGHLSKHILTISEFTRHEYAHFARISLDKITTTYLASDAISSTTHVPNSVDPNAKFLLFVGQQNDHKNVRTLIEAHQLLIKEHPKLQLVFAGKIKDEVAVNQRLVKENACKNIIFTDFVTDAELAWLYEHTIACVIPSFYEGFGLPGLEAMMHSSPVISSNTSCLPEVYEDSALYFDPHSTEELVARVEELMGNTNLRKRLQNKGHKQVKKYSWKRMAEETLEVYKKALED